MNRIELRAWRNLDGHSWTCMGEIELIGGKVMALRGAGLSRDEALANALDMADRAVQEVKNV